MCSICNFDALDIRVFNMQFRLNIKMYNIYWFKIGWSK